MICRNRFSVRGSVFVRGILALALAATLSTVVLADVKDRDITLAVENELFIDEAVPVHAIDVSTERGIVTLSGSVDNILARDQAVEQAMSIKGVRSVVNRIKVDAPERADAQIQSDVETALAADPATDSYEVKASTADGVVTLTGTVDSWQEKTLSTTVAKGVVGVEDVKNNIKVNFKGQRTDSEIKADVERRLATSVWIDTRHLDVTVKDGKVSLSGVVGSEKERQRAGTLAWVAGVRDISTDEMRTDWWSEDRKRRDRYSMPSDEDIAAAIEDAMLYDPRVFSFNVEANVRNGVATLTGIVDNLKAKRAAGENAANTHGIWRVKNHLRVRPINMPEDSQIASEVRDALMRDPYVERFGVDVEAIGGRVYLSGDVNTSFERRRAEDVASRVNGVIDVMNSIDYDYKWSWQSDRAIKDDVESQLFWSPFVDSEDIKVTVDDGVVTLTGTASDWYEWQSATENAFEGNAKDVRNKLIIPGTE